METSLLTSDSGWTFVRRTPLLQSRRTILFVHGLGDSSLSFGEAFQAPGLEDFNLVAPDLPGHGCSSDAPGGDSSFRSHIQHIYKLVDELNISEFTLVGHSLGGDIATHLTAKDTGRVKGLINIEGNITPSDVFISREAVKAAERGAFEGWFREDFMNELVLNQWGAKWASCQRYYASLWFCRPQSFLSNAREICERNSALPHIPETETGSIFLNQVIVPKVYCWGGNMSEPTRRLIEEDKVVKVWGFEDAFHWPMIDKKNEFYSLLAEFCSKGSTP